MKKINCILFLVVAFACNTFSQRAPSEDFGAKLLTQKWFSTTDFGKKESVFFTSVPVGKAAHWEAHFLGTDKGKFMRCDSLEQEIAAGAEADSLTKYQRYQCDSSATYVIRGNKLRIVQSGTSYFYTITRVPLDPKEKVVKLELSVLDPQQFYR
jgi:hypothetical protein